MTIREYLCKKPVLAVRLTALNGDEIMSFVMANARCKRRLHYLQPDRIPQVWSNAVQAWAQLSIGVYVVADQVGIRVLEPEQFEDEYVEVPAVTPGSSNA